MYKRLYTILFILIFCVVSSQSWANFAGTYGFSAEGLARGNAMSATVNNWSSLYYNIAGLGKTRDSRIKEKSLNGGQQCTEKYADELALNYLYGIPLMSFNHPTIEQNKQLDSGYIGLGFVLDLNHFYTMPKFISSARFGAALGSNMYYDRDHKKFNSNLAMAEDLSPDVYDYLNYGKNSQCAMILAGVGFGFLDDMFGFGLGVSAWMGGQGYIQMSNVKLATTPQSPSSNARLDVGGVIAPNIGLYYRPLKFLDIGFNWIGELYMEIDPLMADATIVSQTGGEVAQMKMAVTILDFFTPHTFKLGLATQNLFEMLTINLDVEYKMWSRYKFSRAKREYFAERGIAVPKLRDTIVPRLGVEVKVFDWLYARGGCAYEMSALSDDFKKSIFNLMDNDKIQATAGLGFIIPKMGPMTSPVEINLGVSYQFLLKQNIVKDDQTYQIYLGLPNQATINNDNYNYSGHVITASLEAVMRW